MINKIQERFERMESKLHHLMDELQALSEESLHKAEKDKWDAVQILRHLQRSEEGTSRYIQKKRSSGTDKIKKAGPGSWIRSILLKRALRNYSKKYKAPSLVADIPKGEILANVYEDYLFTRKKFKAILATIEEKDLGLAIFRHPVAGRLTILQTLGFMEDHFDRHASQIKQRVGI